MLATPEHAYTLLEMCDLPECNNEIDNAETGYGAAKPSRCNRLPDNRQARSFDEKGKQIIVAPVADHADAHPRQKHEIESEQQTENYKENDGKSFDHTVKV